MPVFATSSGKQVRTADLVGAGGEGSVYEVSGSPDLVAKIYHQPLSSERAQKVLAMSRFTSSSLEKVSAWPRDLLYSNARAPVGLLMPRVRGHKDIHKLYSPRSRKIEFPAADFAFLLHASANIARAFTAVHEAGFVIGDVNHGSIIVAENATAKLIDCDSFQITVNGSTYPCNVGVPTFTPPELQGRALRGIVRTANHDNFGLAVLIFHLLLIGRHPFAGRYLGRGDMQIETAIQQFRFAYGFNSRSVQMEPPPNVPALAVLTEPIAALFERAFSRTASNGAQRPVPSEWSSTLSALTERLAKCTVNPSHTFPAGQTCPWCPVEASTGIVLFDLVFLPTRGHGFDIAMIWRTIEAVQLPPIPPKPTEQTVGQLTPSPQAKRAASEYRTLWWSNVAGAGAIVLIVAILLGVAPQAWWLWLGGAVFFWIKIKGRASSPNVSAIETALSISENRHDSAQRQYSSFMQTQLTVSGPLAQMKSSLLAKRNQWQDLPQLRAQRIAQLQNRLREQQLETFLEGFHIDRASISNIGLGRKAVLQSYGIETAADIDRQKIRGVPGFGPAITLRLVEWRRSIERSFRFDPTKGIEPRRISALDAELATLKKKLEQELSSGPVELLKVRRQIEQQHAAVRMELEQAIRQLAQCRTDKRALAA